MLETDSVSTDQLRVVAGLSFECRNRALGVLALETALERLLAAEPRHHAEIAAVLRQLVHRASSRQAAWPYFKTATRLLDGYSAANAPFGTDELQWLLAEAWNRGVAAFRESKLEEAESWIATAFSLSGYAAALAPWREEVNEGCECLRRVSNAPESFERAHAHGSPLSLLQTKSA